MSILNEPQGAAEDSYENELPVRRKQPGSVVVKWLTTTTTRRSARSIW